MRVAMGYPLPLAPFLINNSTISVRIRPANKSCPAPFINVPVPSSQALYRLVAAGLMLFQPCSLDEYLIKP